MVSRNRIARLPLCDVGSDLKIIESTWSLYFPNSQVILEETLSRQRTGFVPLEENGSDDYFEQ